MSLTVLLGGARAGKSALALELARGHGGPIVYVATAEFGDDEMAARIAQHRTERPDGWRMVEEPVALGPVLASVRPEACVVVARGGGARPRRGCTCHRRAAPRRPGRHRGRTRRDDEGATARSRSCATTRSGSFGAVELVVVLVFEASLLAAESSAWSAFAAAAASGRWAALPHAALLPRPRGRHCALAPVGGKRRPRTSGGVRRRRRRRGFEGLAAVGAAALTALVLGLFFRRWLGSVTGDMLGATSELAQAAALAALLLA